MPKDHIRLKASTFYSSKLMKELSEDKNETQIKSRDFSPGKKMKETSYNNHISFLFLKGSILTAIVNPLSGNLTKWLNTLKQFVGSSRRIV